MKGVLSFRETVDVSFRFGTGNSFKDFIAEIIVSNRKTLSLVIYFIEGGFIMRFWWSYFVK